MARELIIKIKCDKCKTELTESEVHTGEVSFDGKTYALDLCEGDYQELVGIATPKAKALTDASKQAKIVTTPHGDKKLPCPACGHMVKNELGLSFHIKKMHPGSDISRR